MVVNGRPLKRAKLRVTADLLTFHDDGGIEGPFRNAVTVFLKKHARWSAAPAVIGSLVTYRVAFRVQEEVVELDVVEEDVARARSVYCDQCRVGGWSGHPVCGKRYHFIIRNDANRLSGYLQTCTRCGSTLHMLDSRCISCNYEITNEDFEDWAYLQLEDTTHLLHGVVHANGYGHLLRVNGREGGSQYLTGCDIMGFWDRLCKMLHVRKVTVMDISKKHGMEYRLLHAVTTGHPWYGEWGYEFGAGSYALTSEAYKKAVEKLSNMPLKFFFSHTRSPRTTLQNTIALYWSLSDRQLETVRDLFCYITHLLHGAREAQPQVVSGKKQIGTTASGVMCAWTKEDAEKVEEAMVKVLRAVVASRWVTWHALRGAMFRAAASPELLDYCLKGLGGKVLDDGLIVAVRCNPDTNTIEYRLETLSTQQPPRRYLCKPSSEQLVHDLKFLYDALLDPVTMHCYKPQRMRETARISAAKLLDCKQFIKHYDQHANSLLEPTNPFTLYVWCHVELVDQPKDCSVPPELLVLPINATVGDLKFQATKAFQETYLIFQRFQAEKLLEYGDVKDSTNVKLLLGNNAVVKVRGRCFGDERRLGQFRMERGMENWIVDCACGAKDDDGERMMACDACGVWQHTRCAGISDFDQVPVKFVCKKCSRLKRKGRSSGGRKYKDITASNGRCKDEIGSASISEMGGYGCMTTVG